MNRKNYPSLTQRVGSHSSGLQGHAANFKESGCVEDMAAFFREFVVGLCCRNDPLESQSPRLVFSHADLRIRALPLRFCEGSASSKTKQVQLPCGSGEIGRRARLRGVWGNPCRFKSCLPHSSFTQSHGSLFALRNQTSPSLGVMLPTPSLLTTMFALSLLTAERLPVQLLLL